MGQKVGKEGRVQMRTSVMSRQQAGHSLDMCYSRGNWNVCFFLCFRSWMVSKESQGSEDKMTGRASTFYLGGVRQSLFIYTFFFFPFLLDAPHGMQDVSSLTRDGTPAPCSRSTVLTIGLPGEPQPTILIDVAGTQLPGLWRAARRGLRAEAGTQQALRNRYQNSYLFHDEHGMMLGMLQRLTVLLSVGLPGKAARRRCLL